mgnify:CR=1 FL=1
MLMIFKKLNGATEYVLAVRSTLADDADQC